MSAGIYTSQSRLGIKPRGMWLPECAYRPTWDHWLPSVLYDNARHRVGLEKFIAGAGITHFFVDTHLITGGQPMGTMDQGNFQAVNEAQLHWDTRRGWRDVLEPVGVVSRPRAAADASPLAGIRRSASRSGAVPSDIPATGPIWNSTKRMPSAG